MVLGRDKPYFVVDYSGCNKKNSENDICRMFDVLIDTIFVMCDGRVFQQTVRVLKGTNCASLLLADLFLHSYKADFTQSHLHRKQKRYILVSRSAISEFGEFVSRITLNLI